MSIVLKRREKKTRIRGLTTHGREGVARLTKAWDQIRRNRDVTAKVEWNDVQE